MSNRPDDGDTPSADDPFGDSPFGPGSAFEKIFRQLGLPVPQPGEEYDVAAMLRHVQGLFATMPTQAMTTPGGGINWTFAKDTARKVVASLGPDPTPSSRQRRDTIDAIHLAELWLNDATSFEGVTTPPSVWSRAEWVEASMPAWQTMVEPIVSTIAREMGSAVMSQMAADPSMSGLTQMMQPMLQQSASGLFGAQFGEAVGRLGAEVCGATDVGLPLTPKPQVALVLTNVLSYGAGLDLEERDVVIYHALREAARQRLFASAAWVGPQLTALVLHYAREITLDPEAFADSVGRVMGGSPDDLAELSDQLGRTLFSPAQTPLQTEILGRLETLLALVEGWVDDVVAQATARYMPSASALAESVRRRRATGGPAEQTFARLVGLELRPRRLRDAANLWAAYRTQHGTEARDAVWRHPDLVPTAADLDDPLGFVASEGRDLADDLDADLARLLEEERGEDDGA
jgi:putative hydrolase